MANKNSTERPKGSSLKPLKSLGPFIFAYRGTLIAALLALLVASAALLALPVALRYLIDNGFATNDVGTINRYFGWFFAEWICWFTNCPDFRYIWWIND